MLTPLSVAWTAAYRDARAGVSKRKMPAKNCAQLRAAFAAEAKGEAWGKEMIEKTPQAMKERCGREKRNRKRRFSPQRRGE